MKVYLDYSATTPTDDKVIKAMLPYWSKAFGNPASLHSFGQTAQRAVIESRQVVADFFAAEAKEIIFTSGATEADNLAVNGVIRAILKQSPQLKPHVIVSSVEHEAVRQPCLQLAREGVEVDWLPVDKNGLVDPQDIQKLIKENTVLVTVAYVNSEIGIRQPIREIGQLIKKINRARQEEWRKHGGQQNAKPQRIYFHTDATQAVNYFDCRVNYLNCDLLSFSGHKIYGPKGIGGLYVKAGTPLLAVQLGGHQELNRRSGTLNVPGIIGLAKALELVQRHQIADCRRIALLRNRLVKGLKKDIPDLILNTKIDQATPSHAHFSVILAEGEALLLALDLAGIAVSTGSACASGSLDASNTLLAMGISQEVAHYSVRFTLGRQTTVAEIDQVIKKMPKIVARLRSWVPELKN
ncbi:MAG TPA: cysteine desulfurase family protein [bacterium]|mgnify:CR=1 FL=1|nr:cysteine desulfurase family protein [bacterium]